MTLNRAKILKSRTVWCLGAVALVQIANTYHPSNPLIAQYLTYAGLVSAAYFRANARQGVEELLTAAESSLPVSTSLDTFGAPPPEGLSAVADLAKKGSK